MEVPDEPKAGEYLRRIGYYRLSAYWHPMRIRRDNNEILDNFYEGTSFSDVTNLYTFDGRLRLIVLDALERLEVSLRTEVALSLGQYDPKAHRKLSFLGPDFAKRTHRGGATKHREWLQRLDNRANNSKDQFAQHFRTKYPSEDMPVWIAVELLDFGPLSHLISGMRNSDLVKIGKSYGGIKPPQLKSWARSLSFTRNVCAHHSRLWNKPLVNQPSLVGSAVPESLKHVGDRLDAGKRLYSIALVAVFMLNFANPRTSWKQRFISHIKTFPETNRIKLASAGFPDNWTEQDIWN
ncbi:Abi family protein [Thalassorhabdomicrobium marinisediminis]|uniref:Abi family protein n=1 Tax=Thalassorhabdomicrobium marinisediminis TaxID=2170577 RepID=UPI00248FAE35|nr:Abi family protein [Thalassorhabdomicrobium marinisediminis]